MTAVHPWSSQGAADQSQQRRQVRYPATAIQPMTPFPCVPRRKERLSDQQLPEAIRVRSFPPLRFLGCIRQEFACGYLWITLLKSPATLPYSGTAKGLPS